MACDGGNVVASEGEGMHVKMVVMMLKRVILFKKKNNRVIGWPQWLGIFS